MGSLWNAPLTVLRRIISRFSRSRLEAELREEMESHVALRRDALIHEGMDPRSAAAEARRLFGNATQLREHTRDMWGFPAIESVLQDVRYGARMLFRAPIFTTVAVVSIAGGLTAGTGIFATMNAIVFRPIGVGDSRHLYRIFTSSFDGAPYGGSSYMDAESFRDALGIFASMCTTEDVVANVRVGDVIASHAGEIVNPGCFDALKLTPQLGRFFTDERGALTSPPPVVISHGLWVHRFARDSSVIGRSVQLSGMFVVVAAVAPQGFAGTSLDGGADFWARADVAPAVLPPGILNSREQRRFHVYARLRDGVSVEQARASLAGVAAQLGRLDARAWINSAGRPRTITLMSEPEARFAGAPPGAVFGIVASVVASIGIIIAIACLNLATMLLARGASRAKEISIRLAIGASRRRVLRQLATESLMIAVAGGGVAIAAVAAGIRVFNAYRPTYVPAFDVALDWRVLTFAIVLALAAALLFGLAPAAHTLRLALTDGLKNRVFARRVRWLRVGAREALIVLQVAVSIALLLVSTLFVKAIAKGSALSPGFNVADVAVVRVDLEAIADSQADGVTARLLHAAESVPGIDRVSMAGMVPMSGSNIGMAVRVDSGAERSVLANTVSPGYFATLEIPLRAGRDFDRRDTRSGAPVVIVSETFARATWGSAPAIGRTLVIHEHPTEVVGVVADTRYRAVTEPFQPVIYVPIAQVARSRFLIHARVRGGQTLAALDAALRTVDPRAAIDAPTPLRAHMDRAMAAEHATQWIGAVAGLLQLALAMMALWGLVAYAIERRTAEMGVRLALGATPSSLIRLMMKPAVVLIATGVGAGCALGAAAAKIVQSGSAGLAPLNFVVVLPVAAAFSVIAIGAAWWPARRAGILDPSVSLRGE